MLHEWVPSVSPNNHFIYQRGHMHTKKTLREFAPSTMRKKFRILFKPCKTDITEDLLYRGSGWYVL